MAERTLTVPPRKTDEDAGGAATLTRPGRPPAQPATPAGYPRRPASKFGAAADGWDAYNTWLDRVRKPAPPSRQAVIAKSLYSLSSYRNWADKARGAFDKPK